MDKPVLSAVQRSWLLEIGMEARMLAHFSTEPFAETSSTTQANASADAKSTSADHAEISAAPARNAPDVAELKRVETPNAVLIADLLQHKDVTRRAAQLPKSVPSEQQPAAAALSGSVSSMPSLREQAERCQGCGLHEVRGRVVFGSGAESSVRWMFIGEAPGGYDDSSGLPFQGRPGDLLRAMLSSIGIGEGAATYFTNVLKCRPIGNRSPQPEEVAACMPMLRQQIQLLQPACLVALGRVAASALLGREDDLDALRGQVHRYVDDGGISIPLVVTHHPAALLLHGQLKADAWRDLQLLLDLPAAQP